MAIETATAVITSAYKLFSISAKGISGGKYPNVRKRRTQALNTISSCCLRDDRDNGKEYPHEAVLEDAEPDNLT